VSLIVRNLLLEFVILLFDILFVRPFCIGCPTGNALTGVIAGKFAPILFFYFLTTLNYEMMKGKDQF
jgi:hypothetical protein